MDILEFLYVAEALTPTQLRDRFLAEPAEEIGKHLLALWFVAQAQQLGVEADAITLEFAERMRLNVLSKEATTAANAAVEKALHKAASGDFATAGRLLREHVFQIAIDAKYLPAGIKKLSDDAAFNRSGADAAASLGDENRSKVHTSARDTLEKWKAPRMPSQRALAKKIAQELGMPVETVRGHLKGFYVDGEIVG